MMICLGWLMINILFNTLVILVLFIGLLIVIVGAFYVLTTMLNWVLEIDVLWNIKRKARQYIYGTREKKEPRRFYRRRTKANIKNTFGSKIQRKALSIRFFNKRIIQKVDTEVAKRT